MNIYKIDKHTVLLDSVTTTASEYKKKRDSLITSYINIGYFNLKVDSIVSTRKKKYVYVDLGNKYSYIKIMEPVNASLKKEIEKRTKHNFTNGFLKVKIDTIPKFILDLKKSFLLDGFSFVSIQLVHFSVENPNTIRADILINKSSVRKINGMVVKGYPKMPKSFLKRRVLDRNQTKYSKNAVLLIAKELDQIPFVEQIRKPEVLFTKDSTIVYAYLKKSKKNYFDGLVGFSTENKKVNFTGHLNLFLQNVFDYGEIFQIKWNKNQTESQDLDIAIHTPYIFSSPIDIDFETTFSKRDSTFLQMNFNFGLSMNLRNNHKIGLTYFAMDNSYLLKSDNLADASNFFSNFYGVKYLYKKDSKNKYAFRDISFLLESSFGQRVQSKKSTIQYKMQVQLSKNWNLYQKHFLVTKLLAAKLFSSNYLPNEVYRIGGDTTIRGIRQNSLYVTAYALLRSEYRFYQDVQTYFYSFTDLGIINDVDKENKLISFGIGYNFKLPSGGIDINYAINKIQNKPTNKGVVSIRFKTYF